MSEQTPFEFQPMLAGNTLRLRPLTHDDFESLHQAASDPLIWEQHPSPNRFEREIFECEYFRGAMASGSLLVTDCSGGIIGCSRFYDWDPVKKEVAIGYTFLVRAHWGGATNREKKSLMIEHAFRWAERVWFHIGSHNWRSRRAVEKIGGIFSHEGEKELNGKVHDYAFYFIDRPRKQDQAEEAGRPL